MRAEALRTNRLPQWTRVQAAKPPPMHMRVVLALTVVGALALLPVATRGKNCHYNAHFAKRIVCTRAER